MELLDWELRRPNAVTAMPDPWQERFEPGPFGLQFISDTHNSTAKHAHPPRRAHTHSLLLLGASPLVHARTSPVGRPMSATARSAQRASGPRLLWRARTKLHAHANLRAFALGRLKEDRGGKVGKWYLGLVASAFRAAVPRNKSRSWTAQLSAACWGRSLRGRCLPPR